MVPDLTIEERRFFASADLSDAERKFETIKARTLKRVTGAEGLMRARAYLRSIENLLAEKHDARRARRYFETQQQIGSAG